NRKTAMGHPPFWRGINILASDVAKLPLIVHRRTEDDGKERATDHPAYRLLKTQPNDRLRIGAFHFKRTMQALATIHGNSFAAIVRDGRATPLRLWGLSPTETTAALVNGE